jgi:hypothetical protein
MTPIPKRKPRLLLIGYANNHFTRRAQALLELADLDYVFVEAGYVHPDGSSHPYNVRRVPALRFDDDTERYVADGIDQIEQWLNALSHPPNGSLTPFPIGSKKK